jgi:hypothetical protein
MFGYAKCERKLTLECQRGEGFLKLGRTKLPDLIEFRLVESVNFNECETECFKNCSRAAYTHSNTSGAGNGCIMWFGDLIDTREQSRTLMGQDIFMRVRTHFRIRYVHFLIYGFTYFQFKRKQIQCTSKQSKLAFSLCPWFRNL